MTRDYQSGSCARAHIATCWTQPRRPCHPTVRATMELTDSKIPLTAFNAQLPRELYKCEATSFRDLFEGLGIGLQVLSCDTAISATWF